MAEPTVACASAAGAIAVCGSIFGMPWEALMLAAFASTLVSILAGAIDNRAKTFAAIGISTMAGGIGGPFAASWIAASYPTFFAQSSLHVIQNATALVIGIAGPTAIPVFQGWLKRKGETI